MFKFVREVDLLNGQAFNIEKFNALDEYTGALEEQIQCRRELELLQVQEAMVGFTNKYLGTQKALRLLGDKIEATGLFRNDRASQTAL